MVSVPSSRLACVLEIVIAANMFDLFGYACLSYHRPNRFRNSCSSFSCSLVAVVFAGVIFNQFH